MTTPATPARRAFVWLALALASILPVAGQETEWPYTTGPGKFLFEIDGVRLSLDQDDGAGNSVDAVAVASTIVSVGLSRTLDLQVGVDLFLRETVNISGARSSRSGIGDLSFRAKWTFWSDNNLGVAVAVIPYVKVPSGERDVGSDAIEGGLIFPWAMTFGGFHAGAMFQWDHVRNDARDGYDAYWYASGFIQRYIVAGLSVYGEASASVPSTGFSDRDGRLGLGVTFQATKRILLDYEMQRGITDAAAKWTHTFRVTWGW